MISADEIVGDPNNLSDDEKDSINVVLEYYGDKSPYELRTQTHLEAPWRLARGNLPEDAPSNEVITLESMYKYYSKHRI